MPDEAKPEQIDFLAEHIDSRKEWGAYVDLMTRIRRTGAAQADEFLAGVWRRLERALQDADKRPAS
jgi:hypothetical protein